MPMKLASPSFLLNDFNSLSIQLLASHDIRCTPISNLSNFPEDPQVISLLACHEFLCHHSPAKILQNCWSTEQIRPLLNYSYHHPTSAMFFSSPCCLPLFFPGSASILVAEEIFMVILSLMKIHTMANDCVRAWILLSPWASFCLLQSMDSSI